MTDMALLATGLDFPEGPVVADDGAIWLSELRAGTLCRVEAGGRVERFEVGGAPNGLAFAADRSLWFCDQGASAVRRFDIMSQRAESIAGSVYGTDLAAPNDLAFAPDGHVIFTCPGQSRRTPDGYVCALDATGEVRVVADHLLFPNGVCFAPGSSRVYVAETYGFRVRGGTWGGGDLDLAPLFDTPGPIGADGVVASGDGHIMTCVHGAGIVRIADAAGGSIRDVFAGDDRPAGCTIDPRGRWDLIVTGTAAGVLIGLTGIA